MTYMTSEQLAEKLNYTTRYVRNVLTQEVFIEGRHYVRPFGRRRILYLWENIEADMFENLAPEILMANGEKCHG
ncbi:hypothetical protein GM160_04135 [Guyparkeria halophila]|jgi:hypothetical protein|uniref:DNA-binding protein n=1 Tax=Guyparkeria halophila TaxID=47960 RepID=A0A6I6CZR9_9GAMM|nr:MULTISPECIES: hypothetical protein [Chromatiales]MCG5536591.1 hypothetical protein [Ectothiorhodospira mobilis]QGT78148.1 hypothetical protein GM160_04135 [Guyparkeria halophila]RRQ24274.1 hypothetical protein D5687_04145 [Guyparkeria sp. SCN-R1]